MTKQMEGSFGATTARFRPYILSFLVPEEVCSKSSLVIRVVQQSMWIGKYIHEYQFIFDQTSARGLKRQYLLTLLQCIHDRKNVGKVVLIP